MKQPGPLPDCGWQSGARRPVTIEGVPLARIIIALFFLALGVPATVARTKLLIEHQRVAYQTTLLGGRWKVGENGVQALLLLSGLARLVFFVTLAALVVGLVNVDVGARLLWAAILSYLLLHIVEQPLNLVTLLAFTCPLSFLLLS